MKIICVIVGGCLMQVLCDDPEAEVTLLDFDNARGEDDDRKLGDDNTGPSVAEMEHELEIAESSMTEVF